MLYWFFVKGLGPIAIHRLGPTAQGLENIPHEGGAIIAANHQEMVVHVSRRVPRGPFRRFQITWRTEPRP